MTERSDHALRRAIAAAILIVYVAAMPSCTRKPEPAVPLSGRAATYEARQGALLFARYCAVCHGQEGKGDGFNAFNLDPRPRDLSDSTYMSALSDAQVMQTISGGGRSVNKSPLMPAYGWTLSREEIFALGSYVRTLAK